MTIDRSGWPFVLGAAVPAGLAVAVGYSVVGGALLALAVVFLFFFRDPDRTSPTVAGAVLAPADGRVVTAGPADPRAAPEGDWLQVSIFLSPLDVHVNRVPMSGTVTRIDFRRGRFLPAYHDDAAGANERSEIWLDSGGRTIVFRQVVGLMARRVVCRLEPGRTVAAGERFGVMKFGSRMDVFLPTSASLAVEVGQYVVGGVTVVARVPPA